LSQITVINPDKLTIHGVSFKEMKTGTLYKLIDEKGNIREVCTIYTRSLSGDMVWFENGRIGTNFIGTNFYEINVRFAEAPRGTEVILRA
jgi:hypothetical protein